ncbi:MAG TPA: hypothetical protein VL294_12025 [Pseudolysinimonas sp.]|nr:hypothetical protein [Pseudolysinimonas sp.]
MRFVIAIVLFVVALVTIGYGIAQRTVLRGPDTFSTELTTGSAPITVIDGAAINALPGTQTVDIEGQGDIFLAYGRTTDVLAWVGDLAYNHVTFNTETLQLDTTTVAGGGTSGTGETAAPTPAPSGSPSASSTAPDLVPFSGEVPDPHGSDLWVQEFDGSDQLIRKINAPEDISLIIMSDGIDPAPADLTLTWPLDNSAPLSGPLIISGIIAMLAGLAAFLWALVHARRRRGPRRKQPRLPKAPQPKRLKRAPQRKALPAGRTQLVAASGLLLALALTGCTTGGGVLGSGLAPAPTPESTDVAVANNLKPPAVTEQQFDRIIGKVAETVAAADEAKDATLAATRLDGPALLSRTANYKITKKDKSLAAVTPFPAGDVALVLPQQNDSWPRAVFAVVYDTDPNNAPLAMMLVQQSARDNYKVHYLVTLEPGLTVPKVAPAEIGSAALPTDNALGVLPPAQLAQSYGDILINGEDAPDFDKFEADTDTLRTAIGYEAKQKTKKKLPASAKIVFTNGPSAEPPISFPTNDGGQVVAVSLDDVETVTPVEAGAAINATPLVKALTGLSLSTKGFVAVYGVQLLFYVPPVQAASDSGAKIELLGFTSGLINAKQGGK